VETVITLVKMGMVDFGIVPAIYPLPPNLDSQIIGYDGLAVFVAFNYSQRSQGLTSSLNGALSLPEIEELYRGKVSEWHQLGGTKLPVKLYAPDLEEARQVFEHFVLKQITFDDLERAGDVEITTEPPFEMFRSVIRDFEQSRGSKQLGSVGFAPLSWVFGQCSVYPLAIQTNPNDLNPVQPLILDNGQAIKPSTDLCDQKGLYQANVDVFRTNVYPLAYPLAVIFPRDNSLPPAGRKFAEALITVEGQHLIREAGLVPLSDDDR
jgi:ABC-type phosphate transport system substrate-binding protein